jgi:hypothetical protein
MAVRVRRAVRRLGLPAAWNEDLSGAENRARWDARIWRISEREREIDRRLRRAEQAHNRSSRL